MVTCRELVELVTDLLDDALPAAQREDALAHLRECPDCLRYAGQLQLTSRLLAAQPTADLAPEERAELVAAYRDWCTRRGARESR
ncbi:MAG: anti-sigma factor family protein [Actinomycetes bacterium]